VVYLLHNTVRDGCCAIDIMLDLAPMLKEPFWCDPLGSSMHGFPLVTSVVEQLSRRGQENIRQEDFQQACDDGTIDTVVLALSWVSKHAMAYHVDQATICECGP
jgi:hypothetical protein